MESQDNYKCADYTFKMIQSYNITEDEYDYLLDLMAYYLNTKNMPLDNLLNMIEEIGAFCGIHRKTHKEKKDA